MDGVRCVSVMDSALDLEAMGATNVVEYASTRDPALVREKPGKRLTWFTLRDIPTSVFLRYVEAGDSDGERSHRAFAVGVQYIEGHDWGSGGVGDKRTGTGEIATASGTISMWTDKELESIAPAYLREIGGWAYLRAFLPRGSEVTCPLPDMSRAVLRQRMLRLAAQKSTAADSTSTEAPPASTSTPLRNDASGNLTDAIATAEATRSPAG